MSAALLKWKREDLFREISNILHQWPDLDRQIFAQAHYHGQSPESISRSLKLDVEKVSAILKQCDRKLHTSLREFHKSGSVRAPFIPTAPIGPTACKRGL
jgi:DNA-directed RNA polymerase specialized sigma24 family protein